MNSYIKTSTHITIAFEGGEVTTVYNTDPSYADVIEAVKEQDWEAAYVLSRPIEQMKQTISVLGSNVTIEDGVVMLNDIEVHNTLTERMLDMVAEGFDITPMAKFLENLMENPSFRAVTELYDFLEVSKLPITEDGHFLAYKRIGDDYKDIYTHTIDNSPGKVVEMPRNQVNEDKDQTCSTGLHFCAREYLPHYGCHAGSRIVMLKINPRDVVSIPSDYNNAKGRCCRYEVVRELQMDNEYMPTKIEGSYMSTKKDEPKTYNKRVAIQQIYNGDVIAEYPTAAVAANQTGYSAEYIIEIANGKRSYFDSYDWKWVWEEVTEESKIY